MFEWLVRKSVERALRKPTPRRYSLSDVKNDFAHVTLKSTDGHAVEAIITETNVDGLTGIFWGGDRFDLPGSIPNAQLRQMSFKLERVYGRFRTTYSSPLEYLIKDNLGYSQLLPLYDWLVQARFNIAFRQRRERILLLSELVELYLQTDTRDIFGRRRSRSAIDLFSNIYGSRVWGRSDTDQILRRFEFTLESFVSTGEFSRSDEGYALEPAALASLDRFAVEDSRHTDSVTQNKRLYWLTLVLALAAVVQVFVSISLTG